jgi:ParB family chromosome partitioning protein
MTKQDKPRLGRGLASLINTPVEVAPHASATAPPKKIIVSDDAAQSPPVSGEETNIGSRSIDVRAIVASRFQPRETFDEQGLAGLAASIRASGVMQPVLVRRAGSDAGRWELIAGERRWRAAQLAGLERIPAVIVDIDDRQAAEWALVENVQREDLSAMERARALRGLAERFGMSHATLGERVGLDRSSVANLIRLTELEPEVQALLGGRDRSGESGGLSMGHGRALLGARPGSARVALAQRAAREEWSVRRLESAVRESLEGAPVQARSVEPDPQVVDLERQLSETLGTKVRLTTNADRTRGRIVIEFYGVEHFDGVVRQLGVPLQR